MDINTSYTIFCPLKSDLFIIVGLLIFQIDQGVDVNILMFIPTVIIGVIGGILGSLFVVINLKVARTRKRILARLKDKWKQTVFRLIEPVLIMVSFLLLF